MTSIVEQKTYPDEYPAEAVKVLETMTFTESKSSGLKIMGSSALRSQLYAGDYDGYEIVKGFSLDELVKKFQGIIRHLQALKDTYIGDIKSGEIEEWRVVPEGKWNVREARDKIERLLKDGIISVKEAKEALAIKKYIIAKQEIKFHVVRWTPADVLRGSVKLRDGRTYTLEEAFTSPSITKLDVVAKVKGIYTEFSVIYEFVVNGKTINPVKLDTQKSLLESLEYYKLTKNPYKALKRKFAIAKLTNNKKDLKKYSDIINSELGRIYKLYSDVKTLADILEDKFVPTDLTLYRKRLSAEGLPTALLADLKKAKGAKEISVLRHIENQLFAQLSKGTRLKGGAYSPYKD